MSMTDEQIVKGLECCVSHKGCDACEFYMHDTCFVVRHKEIFDLIKRQQVEIEDLKADKEALINGQLTIQKMYIEARDKAAREFAKFLIDKAENNVIRIGDLCDYVIEFNEMTEEKK